MDVQLPLSLGVTVPASAYDYGRRTDGGTHGLVLTKPHVVETILDLVGYAETRDLTEHALLEPACGQGAFLVVAVRRLLISAARLGVCPLTLGSNIRAYDIEADNVAASRMAVISELAHYVSNEEARLIAEEWVVEGDFLLAEHGRLFDFVVGNPPYVRIEQLDPALQREYRRRFVSLYDRADLYVAFIERALTLLAPDGALSYICADRWTVNKYGRPLRKLISQDFSVRAYVELHRASPFESEVIAYPSIFVIARGAQRAPVAVASLVSASAEECESLRRCWAGDVEATSIASMTRYDSWFADGEPWVVSSPQQLSALRSLEARFVPLEASGCKVRIGVATGNDSVYIVSSGTDIESDRLVPLVMRADISAGKIADSGRAVINTFARDGVVQLDDYPRLRRYLQMNAGAVKARHVAKGNAKSWFRTIDRVYPELVGTPKLLIPDIAGANEVAYDSGRFHPHHNLYYVLSDVWDLEVLGGLLSSKVSLFFVWSYAVRMRGGYLRFQAQYLRRIRVPEYLSISEPLRRRLKTAFRSRDFCLIDRLALEAYGLDDLPEFDFVDTRT